MVSVDPRVSMQKLEVLCLVIELGGVHRAAERLFISQPVVSTHLRSLEERIGVPLFKMQGRRLVLTEAGQAVHIWAQSVLSGRSMLERHLGAIVDGGGGSAVIAASMTVGDYYLPSVLFDFKRKNPLAEITMFVSDPEVALRRVETGESDFGVIMTDISVDTELFVSSEFGRDLYVLIASPDSDLPSTIPVGMLSELPAICPPQSSAVRRLQDAALRQVGVLGRPVVMELGAGQAIKAAVAAGLGVAIISQAAVTAEVARGDLRLVELSDVTLTHGMTYVQRRNTILSPLQQRLADAARAALSYSPRSLEIADSREAIKLNGITT